MRTRPGIAARGVAWLLLAVAAAWAKPSTVERVDDQVLVVRDDAGHWDGHGSLSITHQNRAEYQARKILDLSAVPAGAWQAATQVRVSALFCVRDYSRHAKGKANGLDEAFEIVVNGKAHRIANDSGVPVYLEGKPMTASSRWHDFAIPKGELARGPNEIILRKVTPEGKVPDDYLYLAIDRTVPGGNSSVKFGARQPWQSDKLTIPGGKGEYMVRLYLIAGRTEFTAKWRPEGKTDDPLRMLAYAGSHGPTTRVEWDPLRLDPLSPVTVAVGVKGRDEVAFHWLNEKGEAVQPAAKASGPSFEATLPASQHFRPSGIELAKELPIEAVTLRASRSYHPRPRRVDMAPRVSLPVGSPVRSGEEFSLKADVAVLANNVMRCEFRREGGRLRLCALSNDVGAVQMVSRPEDCALFLVEVAGKRYAGSRDFACRPLEAMTGGRKGFVATLRCDAIGLEAVLAVQLAGGVKMGLTVTNRSPKPVDFKLAFPHLAGLTASGTPADDYYFFPWGGGIISDAPTLIRRGYGDHAALYQIIDLFGPKRGAGLAIRSLDTEGRYKVLALRKHVPGQAELNGDKADTPTAPEFMWTHSLPAVPGMGVAFEYLRRTRKQGESFEPPAALLEAHAGDWHDAMATYAAWCHDAWTFRPYPNRLTPIINMLAVGWGQGPLHANAKQKRLAPDLGYRADFIQPRWDCIELMSWWEWAPLGPWRTPWDKLEARLGKATYARYKSYYVKDPVTGQTMYPINRGDYDGYNVRWGGLPALRRAIQAYQKAGQLVTLYTDPLLADDNTRLAQAHGKEWCVVKPDGSLRTNYESWNMCHDVAAYRQFVADTMRRVMRETGADGIRLDEYGHAGAACFSKQHKHTFAEWGCTEWLRA
ncbi:hypothetical protein HQ576_19525, partial [bacterium]|nr:hypothetical protein [bacterium]